MKEVKLIDFPAVDDRFKVVQLYHNSEPVLLCESRENNLFLHGRILEHYLKSQNIDFETFVPLQEFPESLMPKLELSNVYKVVGMGHAEVYPSMNFFQLPYWESRDYGIGVNKEFNELIKETFKKKSSDWAKNSFWR